MIKQSRTTLSESYYYIANLYFTITYLRLLLPS